ADSIEIYIPEAQTRL
nr:Chain B, peptide from Disks large-associated protein 3 [Mus musculus]5IZU_D Chain D, peptide from Disks large-associated protein 3 [Mus musculus]